MNSRVEGQQKAQATTVYSEAIRHPALLPTEGPNYEKRRKGRFKILHKTKS